MYWSLENSKYDYIVVLVLMALYNGTLLLVVFIPISVLLSNI